MLLFEGQLSSLKSPLPSINETKNVSLLVTVASNELSQL